MMSLYPWQHSSSRKSLVVRQRTVPRQNTSEVSVVKTPLCALLTSLIFQVGSLVSLLHSRSHTQLSVAKEPASVTSQRLCSQLEFCRFVVVSLHKVSTSYVLTHNPSTKPLTTHPPTSTLYTSQPPPQAPCTPHNHPHKHPVHLTSTPTSTLYTSQPPPQAPCTPHNPPPQAPCTPHNYPHKHPAHLTTTPTSTLYTSQPPPQAPCTPHNHPH